MAYNRYRKRERLKRQYTFTKTKVVVGFILSAAFSICLSTYFERYGFLIYRQVKTVVAQSLQLDLNSQQAGQPSTTPLLKTRDSK